MKKALLLLLLVSIVGFGTAGAKVRVEQRPKRDVFTDAEYKQIKTQYFAAEGYGDTYNCKVAKERFCKVKDLDTGMYVLCDRQVSKTQMESVKNLMQLERCIKLN